MQERSAATGRRPGLAGAAALLVALLVLGAGVWIYDGGRADGATGTWRALSEAGLERTEVGAARIGDSIYVVGGFVEPSDTTAAVERYDIRRDRWQRAKPMPIAVNHPAVVAHRGFLYVYGGYTEPTFGPVTAALQRFDPRSRRWTLLPASPTPRGAAALAARDGRLYAAGGVDDQALATLEVYDVAARRWRPAPPMRTPREHIAAVATGDGVYVFGGRSGAGEHDTVERFDPARRRWVTLPPMNTARSGFAAVAVGGRPVVFGGEELTPGGTTIAEVELFDPRQRRWEPLPPLRTPRHGLGGAVKGMRIYALQGGPDPGFAFSAATEFLDVPRDRLR
ncbi:MAG TPA: kelch repeat-containing protein [Solirubrobacterales bacterium]|nr:kelch repeat-containing protein [Solirubrobacterales bacterium]